VSIRPPSGLDAAVAAGYVLAAVVARSVASPDALPPFLSYLVFENPAWIALVAGLVLLASCFRESDVWDGAIERAEAALSRPATRVLLLALAAIVAFVRVPAEE
jgi:hypothetical protein